MKLPWAKPLVLPPQLQWKYANEPELMSWSIRARNYNTAIANSASIFLFFVALVGSAFAGDWFGDSSKRSFTSSLILFFMVYPAMLSMTHQKMNFAYRLSNSGIECCEWKVFSKWPVVVVNCFTVIVVLLLIFMLRDDPAGLLLGLTGAGGMGLAAVATLNSERFKRLHTDFSHVAYSWDRFDKISIYKSRHIIGLNFEWENFGKKLNAILNVYCRRNELYERLEVIESLLPKPIPVVVEKFEVY